MFNSVSIPRSERTFTSDYHDTKAVIRVRNIRESSVYHLTFDGDIGRLTGAQLKSCIRGVCGVPDEEQVLSYNGSPIAAHSTGYELGLRSGSMIILDVASRRTHSEQPSFQEKTATAQFIPGRSRFEEVVDDIRRTDDELLKKQDRVLAYNQARHIAVPTHAPAGAFDDIDVDVQIEEEPAVAFDAYTSADVEESRLQQQDYIWKMEQVRFETERLNRQREMHRQKQALEYQSDLLERERLDFERKTKIERMKLAVLQNTIREESLLQAQLGDYHESIYRASR